MFQPSILLLALCAGTLAGPFRIADAEPGHNQVDVHAAIAPDGRFAVAWVDSLQVAKWQYGLDLYIRFFEQDGSPLTDPYKITKAVDTNWVCGTDLDMDSLGNAVLVWAEIFSWSIDEDLLRLQLFDPSGNPLGPPRTDYQGEMYCNSNRMVGVSLNDQGEFVVAWYTKGEIYARRYSLDGGPQGDAFRVHGDLPQDVHFYRPGVALNDAGDLAVTWYDFDSTYPKFQVFDADNESILDWEPLGHLVNEGEAGGTRVEAYWLDNDRFALFWIDKAWPWSVAGRVFADRGLTRYPICRLVHDSLAFAWADPNGWFATALSSDERFAETHTRSYTDYPDTSDPSKKRHWEHGEGILGYIQDNEPIRRTTLFEYTPPWGADTVNSYFDNHSHVQPSAVACSNDRIVWVYSRLNTDSIFEAYAMITDWDMGVGAVEQPIIREASNWEVVTSIGPQVVLHYEDRPQGFHAQVFDATGRKVDELHSTEESGMITWGEGCGCYGCYECCGSGVYFIRIPFEDSSVTQKVVLLR